MANTKTGFDINSFITQNADYARGYTFYITVDSFWTSEANRYLVRSSALPASTITPTEVNWQGNVYKLGTTQEYAEFSVTYSVDRDDNIRKEYEAWINYIHTPETNYHGDPIEYMYDIELNHVSHRYGTTLMTYKLIKAWPSTITEMALDYSAKDVATFDVTFNYQYHITE